MENRVRELSGPADASGKAKQGFWEEFEVPAPHTIDSHPLGPG